MRNVIGAFLLFVIPSVPINADAQPTRKIARVGFLAPSAAPAPGQASPLLDAFRDRLRALGYVEGQNLVLERRYADTRAERLPELAADLVHVHVSLIVTAGSQATRAAKRATATVPIVMVGVGDPVAAGLVTTLARPDGNVTGLAINTGQEIYSKHLELLKEIVPKLARGRLSSRSRTPSSTAVTSKSWSWPRGTAYWEPLASGNSSTVGALCITESTFQPCGGAPLSLSKEF